VALQDFKWKTTKTKRDKNTTHRYKWYKWRWKPTTT